MKYAVATKNTDNCYNNTFTVISIHKNLELAERSRVNYECVIEIKDLVKRGETISESELYHGIN